MSEKKNLSPRTFNVISVGMQRKDDNALMMELNSPSQPSRYAIRAWTSSVLHFISSIISRESSP